jgi:hypothetical protein
LAKGLIEMPSPLAGQPFTLEEHLAISTWLEGRKPGWPRIELALNYPNTPEMFGIVEENEIGPSFFMWRTEGAVIVAPFSGEDMVRYGSIQHAMDALTDWCIEAVGTGKRPKLRPQRSTDQA